MAISLKKIDSRQLGLFEFLERNQVKRDSAAHRAGSFDIDRRFREAISQALKACNLSRFGVASRMSELTGAEISKSMLDSWTCESKEFHRFPCVFLPAFCEAVGSTEPLTLLCELLGVFVLPGPEALRAEIQRLSEDISKQTKERKKRLQLLSQLQR